MTIYVDDGIPALLLSDQLDPAELHEFAARIGVDRSWFRPGRGCGKWELPAWRDHYLVFESERVAAIAAGAVVLDDDGLRDLSNRRRIAAGQAVETSRALGSADSTTAGDGDGNDQPTSPRGARENARIAHTKRQRVAVALTLLAVGLVVLGVAAVIGAAA